MKSSCVLWVTVCSLRRRLHAKRFRLMKWQIDEMMERIRYARMPRAVTRLDGCSKPDAGNCPGMARLHCCSSQETAFFVTTMRLADRRIRISSLENLCQSS